MSGNLHFARENVRFAAKNSVKISDELIEKGKLPRKAIGS